MDFVTVLKIVLHNSETMWDPMDDDFVNPPFKKSRRRKNKRKRSKKPWWILKDSKVIRSDRFGDRPLGLGVFARRSIKTKIYFYGQFVSKTTMSRTDPRQHYGVTTDFPNYMISPTTTQIETGDLDYPWRINHSTDNPSHRLEYDGLSSTGYPFGRPVLIPLRRLRVGDEVTFDYNNK